MLICKAAPVLKFVGTVSLGLLTGVSYTVASFALPSLLDLPSSASASQALASLNNALRTPINVLTSCTVIPFVLSFAFAPRRLRHPYLLYTSLLVILSSTVPRLLVKPAAPRPAAAPIKRSISASRARLDASYEVLGDLHSEAASDEDIDDVNGEQIRAEVDSLAQSFIVRTGFAALGFVMAVVGIWGDGAPKVVVA